MFDAMNVNPLYNSMINEHANLMQNYHNICFIIKDLSEVIKTLEMKIQMIERNQEDKTKKILNRCKYFNTGFCKNREKCPFLHPDSICQDYLNYGRCDQYRSCLARHPKECRYWKSSGKCFRSCSYLHKKVGHGGLVENDEIGVSTEKVVIDEKTEDTTLIVNHDEKVEEISEMTVEDIIKFYEDETNLYTSEDVEDYCDIAHVEDVANPSDNVKTKAKTLKAQSVVLEKSTKKKNVNNKKMTNQKTIRGKF